jgi:DNA invertase Pin-like site-specific DNA recombinase
MKASGYARTSTLKNEQELSLENQTEFFNGYVAKRGDELVAVYSDKGRSGTKMKNRTGLEKMLKAAKRGEFQKLYVKDISRLFRNTLDFITVSRQLTDYGVQLHLVNMGEGKDIDTFTLNLMAMLAENESQKMSERIKFSKRMSQEKGIVPSFVFGYDRVDKFTLVPNPEESEWVKEVFRLYTEELWGMARIAKLLYEKRVKTKKLINGAPNYNWSQNAVGVLLKNQLYIGKVINGRQSKKNIYTDERINNPEEQWYIVEKPEFRIISDETFYKAQELIKKNAAAYPQNVPGSDKAVRRSDKHLFSNIIKCSSCGYSYRRTQRANASGTGTRAWWTCSKRAAYGTARCSAEYIRIDEDWMKAIIENLLRRLITEKDAFYKQVEDECNRAIREYIRSTDGLDVGDVEAGLRDLKQQRERLKQMAVRGIIPLEEAERDMVPINDEIERLMFTLNRADETEAIINEAKKNLRVFHEAFEKFAFDDTLDNTSLKKIIREIQVIDKDTFRVQFNTGDCFDSLNFTLSISYQTEIDTNSYYGAQGFGGTSGGHQQTALSPGQGGFGIQQGRAAHKRRNGNAGKVQKGSIVKQPPIYPAAVLYTRL